MFEGISKERNNFLKDGIKPIEINVGTILDFKNTPVDFFTKNKDIIDKLSTTNFGSEKEEMDAKKALHAGKSTYVISTIDELNKCEKETMEAVIVGGKDYKPLKTNDLMTEWYMESIKLLEGQVEHILKIKAKTVNGPKHNHEERPDLAIFETQKRKLYLIRPEVNK